MSGDERATKVSDRFKILASRDLGHFSDKAKMLASKEQREVEHQATVDERRKMHIAQKIHRAGDRVVVFTILFFGFFSVPRDTFELWAQRSQHSFPYIFLKIITSVLGGLVTAVINIDLFFLGQATREGIRPMSLHQAMREAIRLKRGQAMREKIRPRWGLSCKAKILVGGMFLAVLLGGNIIEKDGKMGFCGLHLDLDVCYGGGYARVGFSVGTSVIIFCMAFMMFRHVRLRALEKCIVFPGRVLQQPGAPCVCSWPGKYASAWDELVQRSLNGETSAAVVFLPPGCKQFGIHENIPSSEGLEGECWCIPLYGEKKKWGCRWWTEWMKNIETARRYGAELHVYFFAGMRGRGKVIFDKAGEEHLKREELYAKMKQFEESEEFQDARAAGLDNLSQKERYDGTSQYSREKERLFLAWLPKYSREFLEGSVGLGNSQKAEVAWLDRKGYPYKEIDIRIWLADGAEETRAPKAQAYGKLSSVSPELLD